jgi:hypothetical protein
VSGRTGPIAPSAEGGGCPGDGGHLPGAAQPAARPQRSPGTPAGPPTITPIHPVSAHQAQAPTGVPFVDVTGVCVPSTPASATSMRHDVVVTRDGHGWGRLLSRLDACPVDGWVSEPTRGITPGRCRAGVHPRVGLVNRGRAAALSEPVS